MRKPRGEDRPKRGGGTLGNPNSGKVCHERRDVIGAELLQGTRRSELGDAIETLPEGGEVSFALSVVHRTRHERLANLERP